MYASNKLGGVWLVRFRTDGSTIAKRDESRICLEDSFIPIRPWMWLCQHLVLSLMPVGTLSAFFPLR